MSSPTALPDGGVSLRPSPELFAWRHAGPETLHVGGSAFTLRPVLPTDVTALDAFFRRLSAQSRFWRFNAPIKRLTPAQLESLLDVDHDRRETLLALHDTTVVAVAQYLELPLPGSEETAGRKAELAIVVADAWQRLGLGRRLLGRLVELARQRGFTSLDASVNLENRAVMALLRSIDQPLQVVRAGAEATATLHLRVDTDLGAELEADAVRTALGR